MLFIGIDISKVSFDVAVLAEDFNHSKQFDNQNQGFKRLQQWIQSFKHQSVFCLEATGIYGLALAKYLYAQNQKVIVVNPIKTNAFTKMEMSRNKTDKADAQSIARYCQHLHNKGDLENNFFTPKDKAFERVQFLVTRLDQLDKSRTQENNRLDVSLDKAATHSIKAMLKFIDKQIVKIKQEIATIVSQTESLDKQVKLLTSIDGFGDKTAWAILAYLGDISLFGNAKQVSSYAGLNPRIEQSGTSIQRSSLSKMGSSRLRKSLYMPALVAVRHNPLMMNFYNKLLKKGKPKKVALIVLVLT